MYTVYIRLDNKNRIVEVNSSAFIKNVDEYIKLDEGEGDKFHHAQGNYLSKLIVNMDGTHNYFYENNELREATAAEIKEEKASFNTPFYPSLEQRTAATEAAIMAIMGGMQ